MSNIVKEHQNPCIGDQRQSAYISKESMLQFGSGTGEGILWTTELNKELPIFINEENATRKRPISEARDHSSTPGDRCEGIP